MAFKGVTNLIKKPFFRLYSSGALNLNQCLQPSTQTTVLKNGMRVSTEDSGAPTATVGLWIDTGSRYENEHNNGVAHFIEHMAFKGTAKRTQTQIELEVENMGAHLNAYTSREQTVFYAKCLSQDIEHSIELLSDILQNSKFDQQAIERERGVILREMEEIEMDTKEVVFDHLHSIAFQGTPLSRTILGPSKNVKSLTRNDLMDYIKMHYTGSRMVLAGAGGVSHDKMCEFGDKYFGNVGNEVQGGIPLPVTCKYTGSDMRYRDDRMPFAHVALAVEGASWTSADTIPLMVANTYIGNWDRTMGGGSKNASALARTCQKHNLVNNYQSFNTCYNDTGLWGIYFVAGGKELEATILAITEEWMHLCTSINDFEVNRAKNALKTNMLLQLDGTTPICEDIGRQMLCYDRRISQEELIARIDNVDAELVRDTCMQYIYRKCPALVGIGPIENLMDYNNLRGYLYSLRT